MDFVPVKGLSAESVTLGQPINGLLSYNGVIFLTQHILQALDDHLFLEIAGVLAERLHAVAVEQEGGVLLADAAEA